MYQRATTFLNKVDTKKLFVESDAWGLFKYSALSEVVGWSLLIYGIAAEKYGLPGASFMLAIGGSIHGMLFLAYIGILAATYSSLGWTRRRALIGFFVSALPYGTLFFEQWTSKQRRQYMLKSYRRITVRGVIENDDLVLALQPNNTVTWQLPGGYIEGDELAEVALQRSVRQLTGITASVGSLLYVRQPRSHKKLELELYFRITNTNAFTKLNLKKVAKKQGEIDELQFIDPLQTPDLELPFLYPEANGALLK